MEFDKLQALADQTAIGEQLKKWGENSDSEELKLMTEAFIRTFFYINSMELERHSFERICGEFRIAKQNAVLRARKAEEKVNGLETELHNLKNKLKVYGID